LPPYIGENKDFEKTGPFATVRKSQLSHKVYLEIFVDDYYR